MAITAGITLTSAAGDLVTDALVLSTSTNLTKAGSNTNALTQTSGLARKTTTSASEYTLFAAADYTDDLAHKLYLKNIETTAGLYFEVQVAGAVVGRLHAGDWALIPWSADTTGTNCDVDITPSTSASHTLEYALFYE